ncbi:MAG: Modification methylase DpnIIA [Verrucomicrobia subdivision 3 bacterium]|nr:Modification methylase DpnIIA [Limisphaerales bacterium]
MLQRTIQARGSGEVEEIYGGRRGEVLPMRGISCNKVLRVFRRMGSQSNHNCSSVEGRCSLHWPIGWTACLYDVNEELVLTYQVVRTRVEELIEVLRLHQRKNKNAGHYLRIRKQKTADAIGIATRFIYLNKTCFNGLYRTSTSKEGSTFSRGVT